MLADPEVHRYDTDAVASSSVAETEFRLRQQVVANGGASWAIRLGDGPAIGTLGIFADQGSTIRGVGWSLASAYWRQGITSEAARVAIPYLLAQPGVDGLEAWIDAQNPASLGVARAAGMTEGGRLPRSYRNRVAQTVVMVRAAQPREPEVFGMFSPLRVSDLATTIRHLTGVLDLHLAWAYPDPPKVAFLAVSPWSGSAGFQLEQVRCRPDEPQRMSFDVAVLVDEIGERVLRLGLDVAQAPYDRPWGRREMTFRLEDGHQITVSGPTLPRG
jgi:RimJ/RimL family protein N-acetyltransferase